MKTKIPMFATTNDTPQWVVAVDGYHKRYDTREAARAVYDSCGGEDGPDGAADTPFGSMQIMPPGFTMAHHTAKVSDFRQIDLEDYIAKRHAGRGLRSISRVTTPAQRLEERKFFARFLS